MTSHKKVAFSALSSLILSTSTAMASTWYEIEKDLCNQIESQGLSKTLKLYDAPSNLKSEDDCIKSVALATRAGNKELAKQAILSLQKHSSKDSSPKLSDLCDFLIKSNSWENAQLIMESFPEATPGYGYILVQHLLEEKTFKDVDDWLKKFPRADLQNSISLRVQAAQKASKKSSLCAELSQELKSHPSVESLRAYILAYDGLNETSDLSWINTCYKPKSAYETWRAGEAVSTNHEHCAAEFFQKAISLPWTEADQESMDEFMRKHSARFIEKNTSWESTLRIAAKQALALCYKRMGASEKAQQLLVELDKQTPGQLPVFALTQFAGSVQQSTIQRPLERRIQQSEQVNKNDTQYWIGRAAYYKGRKEKAPELDALNKALALTRVPTSGSAQTEIFNRSQVVNLLSRFYFENSEPGKSQQFLWQDFDKSNSLTYRARVVEQVFQLDTSWLSSNQTRLWTYLKESKHWEYRQEHILLRMAENCPNTERSKFWTELEKIAKNEPSRCNVLAWVMTRSNANQRAVPLLDFARKNLNDSDSKIRANFTLFEAYLALNKWQEAEAIYPEAKKQLQASEQPYWLSHLAICAAKSGADTDALRIWKNKDNLDRTLIAPLEELKKFPQTRSKLKDYYEKLLKTEGSSAELFQQALKILASN